MNILPALTIGLSFGLVAGVLVYHVIGYFEADVESSLNSVEEEFSIRETMVVPANSVTIMFNGKAKTMAIPSLGKYEIVINKIQQLEK